MSDEWMGVEHWWNNADRKKSKHWEKPGPVPLCPPQIPYRLVYKWTQASVVTAPGLTVRAIYLRWEERRKNAFHCIDQSWCVVLHVACVTNTGYVLTERLCNRNCHTAVPSEIRYVCHISNIWTIIFNIKYSSLLTKEQPVLMAARDNSKKPSRNFSASN